LAAQIALPAPINNRIETSLDSGTIVGRQGACAVITDTRLTLAAARALKSNFE